MIKFVVKIEKFTNKSTKFNLNLFINCFLNVFKLQLYTICLPLTNT